MLSSLAMEEQLSHWLSTQSSWALAGLIAFLLAGIGKGADWLVDESIEISKQLRIPKAIIGATIVSLGTTLPEAVVSVLAAMGGSPELALGNAVGSIICDTGLILGLVILIQPLKIDYKLVNRQGWLQLFAGILLVLSCFPWSNPAGVFESGGTLAQPMGLVFLLLLGFYLYKSMTWSKGQPHPQQPDVEEGPPSNPFLTGMKLVLGISVVVSFSWVLVPTVREVALRLEVPEGIIAATLVAFGTSLPELVTGVTAALKKHGELALGNVIGADILNVLFVAGSAAAVTPEGLGASAHFFKVLFPIMLSILIVFRLGIFFSKQTMGRTFGWILIALYIGASVVSYWGS